MIATSYYYHVISIQTPAEGNKDKYRVAKLVIVTEFVYVTSYLDCCLRASL